MSKLYIVPTPVGNLDDITLRAISTLKEADVILAEDTRTSSVLLKHHAISRPLISHHKYNEHAATPAIIDRLRAGQTVALISDAGTPGISDPGFLLAREAAKAGITVECLPGPTALIPALIDSALPADRFAFEGFLPQKKGRQKRIAQLADEQRTIIIYESPYRLVRLLHELGLALGPDRQASVSREISKVHEETTRGTLQQLEAHYQEHPPKGEIVVVVAGC